MSSGGEGEWPTTDELQKWLDVTTEDWTPQLERHLNSAIEQVKLDVGDWDEVVDEPDASLAQAALLLAIRIASDPSQAPRLLARRRAAERSASGWS